MRIEEHYNKMRPSVAAFRVLYLYKSALYRDDGRRTTIPEAKGNKADNNISITDA